MEFKLFILAGILAVSSSITISPNGNSPERKMIRGGMMIDAQKGLNPAAEVDNKIEGQTNYEKSRKINLNVTKLSLNERYRRLIPYMTFYYANDVASPSTEPYSTDNVEVQKVHIEENPHALRDAKKINIPLNRYIPRYQGNRLTQYNIASANPTSAIKSAYQTHSYIVPTKATPNYNPLYLEQSFMNGHTFGRTQAKHRSTVPSHGFRPSLQYQTRKPYQNLFHADDSSSVKYYESDKEPSLKYKLVPYEQTAPVQVAETPAQNYNYYDRSKSAIPVPVLTKGNNHVYAETRPRVPPVAYDNVIVQQPARHFHSHPATESYYEQRTPGASVSYETNPKFPAAESGFRPIIPTSSPTAIESVAFVQSTTAAPPPHNVHGASLTASQNAPQEPDYTASFVQPEYYDYVPQSQHGAIKYSSRDSATLSDILTTLQKSNSIPQPITKENVGSSIRTLLQVLSALKAASHDSHYNDVDVPILSTPKPFSASPKIIIENDIKPELPSPEEAERATEIAGEQYLAPVNVPSQHLDHDYRGSSQAFPLAIASEDDGGTPGRAGVDYPTLTTIPPTSFDCKTQRYKGFFADPDTKCQVWHYCDLNGGQASFLCPNGTIFSQAALTCDWWFNVRCDSTHQLYVLNERLYKYILPHSPTFPEDYSGPLVDKYLTIKFKEMEEQFRKNKKKQSGAADESEVENEEAGSRADTEEEEKDLATNSSLETENGAAGNGAVSEASVVVESPGNSGTVQHLED